MYLVKMYIVTFIIHNEKKNNMITILTNLFENYYFE